MFSLHGLRSLLLYSINATSFFVKLNECLASRVLDLKGLGRLSNGHTVLLSEFDEHSPGLCGDRVVMVSFLGVGLVILFFSQHFEQCRIN